MRMLINEKINWSMNETSDEEEIQHSIMNNWMKKNKMHQQKKKSFLKLKLMDQHLFQPTMQAKGYTVFAQKK